MGEYLAQSFSFFAPASLLKSQDVDGAAKEPYRIAGIITTEDEDMVKETLLLDNADTFYLENGWGKIKFEHDNRYLKEPDNIIGFPIKLVRDKGKLMIIGELIPFEGIPEDKMSPQQRLAKSVYNLMKAIEEHNKRHPENPQKIGFSVEGTILKRDNLTGKILKSNIMNVVLTTKPVNPNTYATLVKSLSVGYGMTPQTQTGLGATRKESIETSTKQKGEKNMVFKNFEEAKKYFLSQGLSEEEATAKAKEYFEKQNSKSEEEPPQETERPIQKSITLAKERFKSAVEHAKQVYALEDEEEFETLAKSLKKSVETITEGSEVDLTDYFINKGKADISLLEAIKSEGERQVHLAKSMQLIAEGFGEMLNTIDMLAKSMEFIKESQKLNNQALIKSLKTKASYSILPSDLISNVEYVDNNSTEARVEELNKSMVANALYELYKENKVPATVVSAYEGTGYIDSSIVPLVQSYIKSKKN